MTSTPAPLMSNVTRHLAWSVAGAGATLGIAGAARAMTSAPDADGSSRERIDRAEAKGMFSGPTAFTTVIPLATALLAIGMLYTKGRILLPERGAVVPAALQDAAKAAGTAIVPGEGTMTKSLYAFSGGGVLGSMLAQPAIFGRDRYETRHVPAAD